MCLQRAVILSTSRTAVIGHNFGLLLYLSLCKLLMACSNEGGKAQGEKHILFRTWNEESRTGDDVGIQLSLGLPA